ncbi:MAG: RsmB/NOP family class I SAM-dependent RNA methyltransferase [bacterium]|nr:RsmB/NOP family class I SAM-dependent RNA methyltransferase [bacterium]
MQTITHKLQGKSGFIEYYRSLFTESEQEIFFKDLQRSSLPILRFKADDEEHLKKLWQKSHLDWETLSWYKYAVKWPKQIPFTDELPGFNDHLFFPMNASSLLPVLALDPQPKELILDACAAPGGKALFISQLLNKKDELYLNDTSKARRMRLLRIMDDYDCKNIKVLGRKAETLFKTYPNYFDKILADVPCSSEKHVFRNEAHLVQWSTSRIKSLHRRQVAIISGLFLALKPGGKLVYSTCAVTPEENEAVVDILLKKKGKKIKLINFNINAPGSIGWPGEYKQDFDLSKIKRVTPHRLDKEHKEIMDPMFVAVFERTML